MDVGQRTTCVYEDSLDTLIDSLTFYLKKEISQLSFTKAIQSPLEFIELNPNNYKAYSLNEINPTPQFKLNKKTNVTH